MQFTETTFADIEDVIKEAEIEGIFVPTKDSQSTVLETVRNFAQDPEFKVFKLVDEDGEVMGIASLFPNSHAGQISLGITYIKKQYRSKGYGTVIRENIIQAVRDLGYKKIFTKTWASNLAMIQSNKKLGFKKIGEVENDRVNGDATIKFELDLEI